jgi:hypothetical protein
MSDLDRLRLETTRQMHSRLDQRLPDGRQFRDFIADLVILNNKVMNYPKDSTMSYDDAPWYDSDQALGYCAVEYLILDLIGIPKDNWDEEIAQRALRSGGVTMLDEATVGMICRDVLAEWIMLLGTDREKIAVVINELTEIAASVLAEQKHYGI